MLAAQNLRDVGMADAIAQHRAAEPDALVLHVTGSFHSEGGLGIPEHLARLRPDDRMLIAATAARSPPRACRARTKRGSDHPASVLRTYLTRSGYVRIMGTNLTVRLSNRPGVHCMSCVRVAHNFL